MNIGQYEGQASGITTSETWNEYYFTGYHGERTLHQAYLHRLAENCQQTR